MNERVVTVLDGPISTSLSVVDCDRCGHVHAWGDGNVMFGKLIACHACRREAGAVWMWAELLAGAFR